MILRNKHKGIFTLVSMMMVLSIIACSFPLPMFMAQGAETATPVGVPTNTPETDEPTETPTEEQTEEPTEEPSPTATEACIFNSAFVADVTIPDGTEFEPGDTFTKTWRVKNNGCQIWAAGTKFIFVQGDLMGGPSAGIDVPVTAVDGQQDLSVALTAPAVDGTYRGYWQLRAPDGTFFGTKVYVDIVVKTPGTPEPSDQPDLVISNIVPDGDIIDNEPFTFSITVENQGGADSTATDMGCELVGAGAAGTVPVPAIPAGGSTVVQCGYTVDAGDYTFKATVDLGGTVAESNETNNSRTYNFTAFFDIGIVVTILPLLFPDLIVTAATADTHQVTLWIKNQGLGNAPATHVSCDITDGVGGDGTGPDGVAVPAIDAGTTVQVVCLTASYEIPPGITVTAEADCQDEVNETNEDNNDFVTIIAAP